ncbi:methyl-CpG-binding domain-containing protein 7-like isoform X2 [Malania oleifera]|uniref:methyl-CpG-binding domain-containing protein 7-like isoform X2 n=1 Tax=Malania oleifera TaxID=397392 RepID=UPI0025ADB9F0|nr:methyl-CpG-binding domain-containing protein 7-like isoform X2 [Malania oleifera]XP_057956125.1 methyl-CpG-binding domain-containing protein 7-like isoform X2 [Malania oleifera]XP_057956126.1 methyl-CpG-binding domain-containing protein 7-like isoform X2 [Malania oleifera]XP_057956127.1 methyl-CpG-binding domain-containing protein 7-like isoform X2 [Malania oleifera]
MEEDSLPSVRRPPKVLKLGEEDERKMQPRQKRHMDFPTTTTATTSKTNSSSPFKLPDGWVVIKKPRPYAQGHRSDKFYHESATGRKFRSLKAVEKYLTEAKENTHLSKPLKSENHFESQKSAFDFVNPPKKINWVLTSPQRDSWSPFMGRSMVSESEKQLWGETYILSIHD